MVYGRADVMAFLGINHKGLPVRNRRQRFRALSGYKEHFHFVPETVASPVSPERQQQYFRDVVFGAFQRIRAEVEREVRHIIRANGKASEAEIRKVIDDEVDAYILFAKGQKRIEGAPQLGHEQLKKKFASYIESARKSVFEQLPLTPAAVEKLASAAVRPVVGESSIRILAL